MPRGGISVHEYAARSKASNAARGSGGSRERHGGKLDGLQASRFLAAFGVVLFHYEAELRQELNIATDLSIGAAGVDIFFVISGFVISLTGQRFADDPPGFFLHRLARVVPIYWLLTLGVFGISLLAPYLLNTPDITLSDLVKSLFFIPFEKANGQIKPVLFLGWTLNYEMFFYAIFTIAIYLRRLHFFTIGALAVLAAASIAGPFGHVILDFYTSPILLEFAYGVLLHRLFVSRQDLFAKYGLLLLVTGIALLFLSEMAFSSTLHRAFKWGIPATLIVGGASSLSLGRDPLSRLVVSLGDASYSMYLIHAYILAACFKLILPALGASSTPTLSALTILAAAAIFSMSYLSYRIIERPSNEFLRGVIRRWR